MEITKEFIETRPLSYSSLKAFLKSPKHYVHYISTQKSATPSMEFGSLVDCLLLTPDKFEDKYYVVEKVDRRTKEGKAKAEEFDLLDAKFHEENGYSKKRINEEQLAEAKQIVFNVNQDENARDLLNLVTQTQTKIEYVDTETGLPYVGYIDALGEKDGKPIIVELKTCQDASEHEFSRDAFYLHYYLQCAGYLEGIARKKGIFPDFYYLVVETNAPYGVNVIKAPSDYIQYGKEKLRGLFDDFKFCLDNNFFDKSYSFKSLAGYNQLSVPGYIKYQQ